MLKRSQYLITLVIAGIAAVLVVTNMVIFLANRTTQGEVQTRAQYIQQTAQMEVLYRELVKALADLSVKNQDIQLRDMLAAHGITLTPNRPPDQGSDNASRPREK